MHIQKETSAVKDALLTDYGTLLFATLRPDLPLLLFSCSRTRYVLLALHSHIPRCHDARRIRECYNDGDEQVGMVGDAQIGKTSLMVKYVEGSFDEDYIQTLGVK